MTTAAVAFLVVRYGGVRQQDWAAAGALLSLASVLWWLPLNHPALMPPRLFTICSILLPLYVAMQVVPLPLRLLQLLSPQRWSLTQALSAAGEVPQAAPLSVEPGATSLYLARLCTGLVVFYAAFLAARLLRNREWLTLAPLLTLAVLEGTYGLALLGRGNRADGAHGTYANHAHFAGFLALALPLGAAALWYCWSRSGFGFWEVQVGSVVRLVPLLAIVAVLALGILFSNSRMAILASLCANVLLLLLLARRPRMWSLLLLVPVMAAVVFSIAKDPRGRVWGDTGALIASYPVFGCGLGAFEVALLRFKTSGPLLRYEYAHNDYLQALAELGLVGSLFLFIPIVALATGLWKKSRQAHGSQRVAMIGCLGSLAAFLIHSLVDFNFYIPANAMAFCWVCGAGLALIRQKEEFSCDA